MNHLGYSYLENFEDIDNLKSELKEIPKNIEEYVKEDEKYVKNSDKINNTVNSIKTQNEYIKKNKNRKTKDQEQQMINDYHSIVMQQKFVLKFRWNHFINFNYFKQPVIMII